MKTFLAFLLFLSLCCTPAYPQTRDHQDRKITVLGSSTVWGAGLLHNHSMVGIVDQRLRTEFSTSILPENMRFSHKPDMVRDKRFFNEQAACIKGKGESVEFDLEGATLALWQVIRRSTDYANVTVYADGQKIGAFTNQNNTLGHQSLTFKADGKQRMFSLRRPFTYNHKVTLDGKPLKVKHYDLNYVTGPVAKRFPGFDGVIVRARPKDQVQHFIYLFNPPTGTLNVTFDYGETICYTASTVGGTQDENTLESPYGIGYVPFDLANPTRFSTGLDFRYSNPKALWVHRFDTAKKRHVRLEITGGINPYLMLNFASNAAHLIQNAGIGGFTANSFLKDRAGRSLQDSLKIFIPDIAFIILGGNDDWQEQERLVSQDIKGLTESQVLDLRSSLQYTKAVRQADGTYTVTKKTAPIEHITATSLRSKALRGTKAVPGNYVRIGNYVGDNNSTAVRVISAVDPKQGEIRWEKPLTPESMVDVNSLDRLIGADFTIRTLTTYSTRIALMVDQLRQANPDMKIILLNTYTPNYFMRTVWAYDEALTAVAAKYPNCIQADASPAVTAWIPTQLTGRSAYSFKATGANSYTLPWKRHHQGFKVIIDGKDCYGKSCHVLSGWFYPPRKTPQGNITFTRGPLKADNMRLIFYDSVPPAGTNIKVIRADHLWSGDFAHPNQYGCKLIGDVAVEAIKKLGGLN